MKLSVLLLCLLAQFFCLSSVRSSGAAERSVPVGAPLRPVRVVAAAAEGDVATIVRAALAQAEREQRRLIVFAGATWAPARLAFERAVLAGELDATLSGLTVLVFDTPRDGARLAAAGYLVRGTPRFVRPDADGRGWGASVEAVEDVPALLASGLLAGPMRMQ